MRKIAADRNYRLMKRGLPISEMEPPPAGLLVSDRAAIFNEAWNAAIDAIISKHYRSDSSTRPGAALSVMNIGPDDLFGGNTFYESRQITLEDLEALKRPT